MSKLIHFSYRFHPVGQGLFASGYLMKAGENEPDFTWVYDCGTSSSQTLVTNGIEKLEKEIGVHGKIDLLVLSHFDHDHISGVCRLLEKFRIGTLMLPYMPQAKRLVIAFEEGSGSAEDVHTPFFLNPVSFLLAQDGPGIGRILFVLPSGEEGPPLQLGEPDQPDDDRLGPELRFEPDKPKDRNEVMMLVEAAQGGTSVDFFRRGAAMTLGSYWEFVPYNDDPETEIPAEFQAAVQRLRETLLVGDNFRLRLAALNQLKQAYDEHFGGDSEARNLISLHLYAGPIYPSWSSTWLERAQWTHRQWNQLFKFRHTPAPNPHLEYGYWLCSILCTGDGYIDNPERLRRLIVFLHESRVRSVGVFQVMHHGAEANWHPGVAAAISPLFSIFSSNPKRKKWKHPHAAVLRDFLEYSPVQVDKQRSFQAWGILEPQHVDRNEVRYRRLSAHGPCPECGSEMVEVSSDLVPPDDVFYGYHCRECNWADYTQ